MLLSKNIITSLIIGLIDGIRNPLILAAAMTFLGTTPYIFNRVFLISLLASALILALGHWLTIRSENRSATGEALQKEQKIYHNIGLEMEDESALQRKPQFITDALTPSLQVGLFYLLGGLLVYLPFLFPISFQKAFTYSLILSILLLLLCGFAKARYYGVNPWMEGIRTTLLPLIAIALIYGILKLF